MTPILIALGTFANILLGTFLGLAAPWMIVSHEWTFAALCFVLPLLTFWNSRRANPNWPPNTSDRYLLGFFTGTFLVFGLTLLVMSHL